MASPRSSGDTLLGWNSTLEIFRRVTLDKLLNLSVPQRHCLQSGGKTLGH